MCFFQDEPIKTLNVLSLNPVNLHILIIAHVWTKQTKLNHASARHYGYSPSVIDEII